MADTLFYILWKNYLSKSCRFFGHLSSHSMWEPFIKWHQCHSLLTSMQSHHVGIINTRWLLVAWCSYQVSLKFVEWLISYWEGWTQVNWYQNPSFSYKIMKTKSNWTRQHYISGYRYIVTIQSFFSIYCILTLDAE